MQAPNQNNHAPPVQKTTKFFKLTNARALSVPLLANAIQAVQLASAVIWSMKKMKIAKKVRQPLPQETLTPCFIRAVWNAPGATPWNLAHAYNPAENQ